MRGVIESLTAAPSGTTVVVGVDDVHLLDDLSTFVVHQIVQRGAAKVVLTVRDGEPIPAAVQEIWKVGRFERIDLQPLSLDETTALLSATLGGSVDRDAAQRLWQLTRGNVLYLRNIVEQEVADGRIATTARLLAVDRRSDHAARPGRADRIAHRRPTHTGQRCDRRAGSRGADRTGGADADHRPGRRRGGRHPRAHHARNRPWRCGGAGGASALRRGAAQAARRPPGYDGCADWSPPNSPPSEDRDDITVVVRRATLSLDSDLAPDNDLLVRAAHGAVWLADLPLADRLAEAAIRAGAGPEPNFVRAHALSWLGRGEEADAVLAEIRHRPS